MKVNEIFNLKRGLTGRIEELRIRLNLSPEDQQIKELEEFRGKQGLSQLLYYLKHRTLIRVAAELEALNNLYLSEFPILNPIDQDLLELFENGVPTQVCPISDDSFQSFQTLHDQLQLKLTGTQLLISEKNQETVVFWKKLQQCLSTSPQVSDRVLAYYIAELSVDLGLKHAPIQFSPTSVNDTNDDFLSNLGACGNINDYSMCVKTYRKPSVKISEAIPVSTPIHHSPKLTTKTQLFWIFTWTFLDDIESDVHSWQVAVQKVNEQLNNARSMLTTYMRPFINGLKDLFQSWRQQGIESKKAPVETPAISKAPLVFSPQAMTLVTGTQNPQTITPFTTAPKNKNTSWWSF